MKCIIPNYTPSYPNNPVDLATWKAVHYSHLYNLYTSVCVILDRIELRDNPEPFDIFVERIYHCSSKSIF